MSYRVVAHGSNAEVVYRGREIHGSFGAAQREAEAVARSRRGLADVHVVKDGKIVWETGAVRKNPFQWAPRDRDAIGNTPNMESEARESYRSWWAEMSPSRFLSLAMPLPAGFERKASLRFLQRQWKESGKVAPPQLDVSWDERERSWLVRGHEGRHRAMIAKKNGAATIPVLIFLRGEMRNRNLTPEMRRAWDEGRIFSEEQTMELGDSRARAARAEVRSNPSYFVDVIDARTGHVIESRVRRADASATIAYYRMTGNKHLKMRPVPKPPRPGTSRSAPRQNPDIVLRRLPANSAWAFVFGDAVIRLHDDLPMFFSTRKEAVAEAKSYGFTVRTNGRVSVRRS